MQQCLISLHLLNRQLERFNMLILTDLGHDPDDLIAISLLIEKNVNIDSIVLTPGFPLQVEILTGLLKSYDLDIEILCCESKENNNYHPGKHSIFAGDSSLYHIIDDQLFCQEDRVLIIGPPKNMGDKIGCDRLYFQGGYSPNSICPLDKFKGEVAVQSFNTSGAKADFNLILDSQTIKEKHFIGKNVCHGYSKSDLMRYWQPKNKMVKKFFDLLEPTKNMHDVLAAQLLMNDDIGIWEQAKPTWVGNKLTTTPTKELVFSLIGIK